MARAGLVICVLSVQGLFWFRQKRNALNELINTVQYVIGTELKARAEGGVENVVQC